MRTSQDTYQRAICAVMTYVVACVPFPASEKLCSAFRSLETVATQATIPSKKLSVILTTIAMSEINHNARLKGVNQKFEPRQLETFVRGQTKVFKIAGSVRKRFLLISSRPPYFSFLRSPYFSLETLATQATYVM